MSDGARHAVAGAAGGLVAGLVVSGVLGGKQAVSRAPSDLAILERRLANRAGLPHRAEHAGPEIGEELSAHAGHLALSALAGAGYGLAKRRAGGASPVTAGLTFGMAFWALAYGVVGPALRVSPKPWRDAPPNHLQHGLVHALFGAITAVVADRLLVARGSPGGRAATVSGAGRRR